MSGALQRKRFHPLQRVFGSSLLATRAAYRTMYQVPTTRADHRPYQNPLHLVLREYCCRVVRLTRRAHSSEPTVHTTRVCLFSK